MRLSLPVFLALAALAAGCCPRGGRAAGDDSRRDFPAVQIPGIYTEAQTRQAYAAEHFWDRFFAGAEGMACDSVTVCGVRQPVLEEAFSTYVTLLGSQDIESGRKYIAALYDRAEALQKVDPQSNVLDGFSDLAEFYLYDPNSPYRNEDLYQPFVERLARSPFTSPSEAPARAFEARMCALNAAGTPAADFRFTDASGRTHRLYDYRADHTLLIFLNPDCEACETLMRRMSSIGFCRSLISSGALEVVNVYIDEDIDAWLGHADGLPAEWHNGYDPDFVIRNDLLYHVRGIPSLYVLDKDMRVIMKDAPEDRVFAFLESISRD